MEKLYTPAAVLEIKAEWNCFSRAFAVHAKEVRRAFAQPTVVGSYIVAVRRVLFIIIAVSGGAWDGPA